MSNYTYELCVNCEDKGYKMHLDGECATCSRRRRNQAESINRMNNSYEANDFFGVAKEIVRLTYGD